MLFFWFAITDYFWPFHLYIFLILSWNCFIQVVLYPTKPPKYCNWWWRLLLLLFTCRIWISFNVFESNNIFTHPIKEFQFISFILLTGACFLGISFFFTLPSWLDLTRLLFCLSIFLYIFYFAVYARLRLYMFVIMPIS